MTPSGSRWARSAADGDTADGGDDAGGSGDDCRWFAALLAHQLPYPAADPDLI